MSHCSFRGGMLFGHTAYTQTFTWFWVEKLPESPEPDLQKCRSLTRNKNCPFREYMLSFFCVILLLTSERVTVPRLVTFWNEVLRQLIVLSGWDILEVRFFFRRTKRKSVKKALTSDTDVRRKLQLFWYILRMSACQRSCSLEGSRPRLYGKCMEDIIKWCTIKHL